MNADTIVYDAEGDMTPISDGDLLLEMLLKIVDEPNSVKVVERRGDGVKHFQILVAPGDIGPVMGRGGSMIEGMRAILGRMASKQGYKIRLRVDSIGQSVAA